MDVTNDGGKARLCVDCAHHRAVPRLDGSAYHLCGVETSPVTGEPGDARCSRQRRPLRGPCGPEGKLFRLKCVGDVFERVPEPVGELAD